MKLFQYKKTLASLFVAASLFSSCEKVVTPEPLGDKGQSIIKFVTYGGTGTNFSNSGLAFSPTSVSEVLDLNLDYSSVTAFEQDVTVTVGVDLNLVTTYNATQTDPLKKYLPLPAIAYTFPDKQVLIRKGEALSDVFTIEFNPSNIDGSKNFMLPITIKNIVGAPAGVVKASGTGTAYFHFIGNPLAGTYNCVGTRYNGPAGDQGWAPQTGWVYPQALVIPGTFAPAAIPTSKFLAPVTPTITSVYIANLGAGTDRDYYFDIDPSVTTITNINVSLTPSFDAGVSNVRWFQKTYDPANKRIILLWSYNNLTGGAGSDRIIYEVFTKP